MDGDGWKSKQKLLVALLLLVIVVRALHVRSPEGEVVTEELHDEGRVLVGLLREGVELGDGDVEGLLCEVASAVGRVEDLVVEDGKGEGKSGGGLVCNQRVLGGSLAARAGGKLGEVPVVVTLHLVVKDARLARRRRGDEVVVKDVEDVRADLLELLL